MEFKVDGCRSGIEEFTQNLFRKIQREFFDLSRWSMNFAVHYDRSNNYDGKSISLIWKPSKLVYDYLYKKYDECANCNRVYILNVRTFNYTGEDGRSSSRSYKAKCFGHVRYHNKRCLFDDEDNTITLNFILNKVQLSYSHVNQENPNILTRQRIYIVLRVPFLSNTLGFPKINKASNVWRVKHTNGYGEHGKRKIPVGAGPIKFTCSMFCGISDIHGIKIYDRNPFCSNFANLDYKLMHNKNVETN